MTTSQITFVCCIESGSLEEQTIRMVTSLRQYGGQFSNIPIVAVTPRFGPPLSRATHQIFEKYEIEHWYIRPSRRNSQYGWNNFMNKPNAILAVNERVKTEAIAWLDSDLLFVGEPDQLPLKPEESFLACTPDHAGATAGPHDPLDPYWQEICKALNLDIEALPWVTTAVEQSRVRYYFNSGVFVYRRTTPFASRYLENCIQILDAQLSSKLCDFFFTDQIALGLTAFQLNLPWRSLPHSHNYSVAPTRTASYKEELLREACIVHYHDSMWSPFWPTFLQYIQDTHPEVASWLRSIGPMKNKAPFPHRTLSRVLKYRRKKKAVAYEASCQIL